MVDSKKIVALVKNKISKTDHDAYWKSVYEMWEDDIEKYIQDFKSSKTKDENSRTRAHQKLQQRLKNWLGFE